MIIDIAEKQTSQKMYLASPHMSEQGYEMEYIQEAFDTNWIAPLGKNVVEFEHEFETKIGIKSAIALSSGTASIHMALKAVGVEAGDIVLCSTLTFVASANPIIYQNAIPVFLDCDSQTWNMSPIALRMAMEKYTKKSKKPKAVIIVHLYGLTSDMDKILEICNEYDVPLIEDAAESLGSLYKGQYTGTMGKIGIFSFNGNKIITTSGGGMLVSNDRELTSKVLFWSTQSREPVRYYEHNELGFNYRMSNIIAGIGRGQLKVLEQRVDKKRYIFQYYKRKLGVLRDLEFMPMNDWAKPNCWLSCILVKNNRSALDIIEALEKNNIESRPIWKPMHLQPYFMQYDFITQESAEEATFVSSRSSYPYETNSCGFSVAESIFQHGVCLPSDTRMTDKDLDRVIEVIKGLWA